ncbi:MAG: hypothetical protein ACTSPB_14600, partial [Candidatus Thorarchaeota archaeon]
VDLAFLFQPQITSTYFYGNIVILRRNMRMLRFVWHCDKQQLINKTTVIRYQPGYQEGFIDYGLYNGCQSWH